MNVTTAQNDKRLRAERRVVATLFNALALAGWELVEVHNGEERIRVSTKREGMEHVFSVDESWAVFRSVENGQHATVFLTLGNHWDVVADYSDFEPFSGAMDRVLDKVQRYEEVHGW